VHSETKRFQRKVDEAIDIAKEGAKHRLFVALSGGKDSSAVAGIVHEAGIDAPCVHGTSSMALPESRQTAVAVCKRLDMDLTIVEPTDDPWQILRDMEGSLFDADNWTKFCFAAGEIQVLVWYRMANDYEGAFLGLRAKESTPRRLNAIMRGPTYHVKDGDSWACCPIQWWTTEDVYAYLVSRAIPIHPYYRRIYERFGVAPDESRVSMAIPNEEVCSLGALVYLRALYPDLWRRLREARPEIVQYGG